MAVRSHTTIPSFGAYLRELRQERQLVLRDITRRTGLSHGYLALVETDQRPVPPLATVVRLAEALNLDTFGTHQLLAVALKDRILAHIDEYVRVLPSLPALDGWRTVPIEAWIAPPGLVVGPDGPAVQECWALVLREPRGHQWLSFPAVQPVVASDGQWEYDVTPTASSEARDAGR